METTSAGHRTASTELNPSTSSARIGHSWGHFVAWALLALIDAVYIVRVLPLPPSGWRVRALHHLYDAGQLLAIGALGALVIEGWRRYGPRRRAWAYGAMFAVACAAGFAWLRDDLEGVAADLPGSAAIWRIILVPAAASTFPALAFGGQLLARRAFLLPVSVVAGIGLAVTNELALPDDYPGVHLFAAFAAATLLGTALARLPLRARWLGPGSRAGLVARIAIAGAASSTLVVPANGRVVLELFKVPGAVLVPLASRQSPAETPPVDVPGELGQWFSDRGGAPAVRPSTPRLLPDDAIVVLFVVDALRAEAVFDDAHAEALPNMSALRQSALTFVNARSAAPATVPSMTSVFTSRYYSQLVYRLGDIGRRRRYFPDQDPAVRFTELLQRAGVSTHAFFTLRELDPQHGVVRGMDEAVMRPTRTLATEISDLAADRIRTTNGPLFVYLHVADAHAPYDRGGNEGTAYERYLREVGVVDQAVGRMLALLAQPALQGRALFILTADHGEAFGEHNDWNHSHTVYEEQLRVPLLILGRGIKPRSVDTPVSLVDLAPTILDAFGLPTPGTFAGQSLMAFLRGATPTLTRPIVAESLRWMRAMIFPDGWKVIEDRRRGIVEQYDLVHDPAELDNRFPDRDPGDTHLALLRAFFAAAAKRGDGYVPPFFHH